MAMVREPNVTAMRADSTLWHRLVQETSSTSEAFAALKGEAAQAGLWVPLREDDPVDSVTRVANLMALTDIRDAVWAALAHPEAGDDFHRWIIEQASLHDCLVPYHFIMMHAATCMLRDGICSEQVYSEVASRDYLPDAWIELLRSPPTPDAVRVLVALRHQPATE